MPSQSTIKQEAETSTFEAQPSQSSRTFIEKLSRGLLEALNTRNFDPNSWPWNCLPPNKCELQNSLAPIALRKDDFLEHWRKFALANPDFCYNVDDIYVTVDEKNDFAESYVNVETAGARSEGHVVKRAVIKGCFQRYKGEWVLTRSSIISGMGGFF